jgi:pimeloyl-ACP methyl ester carboxylesterase
MFRLMAKGSRTSEPGMGSSRRVPNRRHSGYPLSGMLVAALTVAGTSCASRGRGPPPLDFTTVRPAGQLEGAWVGGTNVLGNYILVEADFQRAGGQLAGVLRAPSENVSRLPVSDVEVSTDGVQFSLRSPFGLHRATGRWDAGMIFGRIEGDGLSGDFHLLPVIPADPAISRLRSGLYSERPGHRLLVTTRAGGALAWAETEPRSDGAVWIAGGTLYGYTIDTVFTDRSIRAEPRLHEWAVFQGGNAIEWHPETRPVRVTTRIDQSVAHEEVTFTNGDVVLAGTLLRPVGDGPHPAAVLVHGSGPAERTNLLGLLRADLLLRQGIAVLVYDKRGVGGSTGNWEQAGIQQLAGDAAAGVALLRRHPSVAPGAVGLIGHSQAGWVIPAAVRESAADFLVVLSGGGVSPREQEIFRARAEAAQAGVSADEAASLMELKWRYGETGNGWDEYLARIRATDPRVTALVEALTDREPARWALLRQLARYDPLPDLRAVRVPTLVVFGSNDDNVPIARAAGIWRETVPASYLTLETIPGVGHALVGVQQDRGSFFPAQFVRALTNWVNARSWSSGGR